MSVVSGNISDELKQKASILCKLQGTNLSRLLQELVKKWSEDQIKQMSAKGIDVTSILNAFAENTAGKTTKKASKNDKKRKNSKKETTKPKNDENQANKDEKNKENNEENGENGKENSENSEK